MLQYNTCGICLTPSTEQKRKTKNQFEIWSIPYYIVKKNYSRSEKHGRSQEQNDHFKARDSTQNAQKKKYFSITDRWHIHVPLRNSQIAVGWTEEYCQYLDSLMSITQTAARKERGRYENYVTLGFNGQGPIKTTQISHKQFTTSSL